MGTERASESETCTKQCDRDRTQVREIGTMQDSAVEQYMSGPILYSNLLYEMGQDFLDI